MPHRVCPYLALCLPTLLLVPGDALRCADLAQPPRPCPCNLALVANGAGDYRCTSKALQKAIDAECLPVCLETVLWSHGHRRIIADQTDMQNICRQGQRLACRIAALRQQCPERKIHLVGHCAGCLVHLAAVEDLPPGSVDKIVLLAPSAPTDYDLRPALACAREGVHVFFSKRDWVCLGCGIQVTRFFGVKCNPTAGLHGFEPIGCSPDDACLFAKLYQYPWGPCLKWTGNKGGHCGWYKQDFLKTFVLPLLLD